MQLYRNPNFSSNDKKIDKYLFVVTIKAIKIEFDPEKSERNKKERGLPFENAIRIDWETAVYYKDNRFNYSEDRIIALGFLDGHLHVVCFTPIDGGVRVISFRKANKREVEYYEQETTDR